MGAGQISFGPFILDRGAQMLLSGGRPIALGDRAFAVLEALASADGNVSRADLMQAAWPGTIVEDGNLAVQIAGLRRALGKRPDGTEWIRTAPRVGYRLVRQQLPRVDTLPSLSASMRLPSVAILPFHNLSSDPEQDYFAQGVVADIITALSRFRLIRVVALNASFKGRAADARDVGQQLQVRYVLEGSVRRARESLRITAQLIETETGAYLWSEHFDRPLADVFAVQDEITAKVVSIAEPLIRRAEIDRTRLKPPSSLDSYDLYLQALSLRTSTEPGSNGRASDLIERSLSLDPDFVPALATAAAVEASRFSRQLPGASEAARLRGIGYAERVLATRTADADARALMSHALSQLDEQYETGVAVARQTVADNANSITVLTYAGISALRSCEFEAAETWFMRAIDLNVADIAGHWLLAGMAHLRTCQTRYEEAVSWAKRSLAVEPSSGIAMWWMMASLAHLGRVSEAAQWRGRLDEVLPGCTIASIRRGQAMRDPRYLERNLEGLRLAGLPES
jgi:TolB-like protein/tetratricopeptide (TPR) repeat protein